RARQICVRCRHSHGRSTIRRGRCASSSPIPPELRPTSSRAWLLNHFAAAQAAIHRRQPAGRRQNVGTAVVAHAPPDGYTLLVVTTTNAINASLYDNLDFDLIRDIAPVAGLVRLGLVIVVNPSVPAQTLPE